MYPSIAFNYDAINISVLTNAVHYNYGIDQLITFEVDSVNYTQDTTKINVHPLKIGFSSIKTSGNVKVNWRNPTLEELKEYSSQIEYSKKR